MQHSTDSRGLVEDVFSLFSPPLCCGLVGLYQRRQLSCVVIGDAGITADGQQRALFLSIFVYRGGEAGVTLQSSTAPASVGRNEASGGTIATAGTFSFQPSQRARERIETLHSS